MRYSRWTPILAAAWALAASPGHPSAPDGLAPVSPAMVTGRTLRPGDLAIEIEAPGDDWSWYVPAKSAQAPAYICSPRDDRFRVVVTGGGASTAAQAVDLANAVRDALKAGWLRRGGTVRSFRYSAPTALPQALRYEASGLVDGRTEHIVGYFLIGAPSVNAQILSLADQEPAELLGVVRSVRRTASSAATGSGMRDALIRGGMYLFDAVLIFLVLWYLYRRRKRPTTLFGSDGA